MKGGIKTPDSVIYSNYSTIALVAKLAQCQVVIDNFSSLAICYRHQNCTVTTNVTSVTRHQAATKAARVTDRAGCNDDNWHCKITSIEYRYGHTKEQDSAHIINQSCPYLNFRLPQ